MTARRHARRRRSRPTTTERARQAEEMERLRRENERLREENAEQAKQIADLERQLALRHQNSTVTSKPPSSDGLAGRQRERGRRTKSRRQRGGQPGHPGHSRALVPLERVQSALQISLSLGSTQTAWEEASAAVAAPYQELGAALPQQAVLNGDETGHRTNGEKRWLWAFVATTFIVYRIARTRGADVLRKLLGASFAGILGSDRLPSYLTYAVGQRQLCWAHFTRNLRSGQELARTRSAKQFYGEALRLQRRLFRLWHRFRGDPTARGALIAKALPIECVLSTRRALRDRRESRREQSGVGVVHAQPALLHLRARGRGRSDQ